MKQYRKPVVLSKIVLGLFGALILIVLAQIGWGVTEVQMFERVLAGAEVSEAEAVHSDNVVMMLGLAYTLTFLMLVVFYCMYIYRANKNARALGVPNMGYSPGWTVGYFFIPILNLFRPYQAVTEIVKASDPDVSPLSDQEWKRSGSAITGWWWGMWLSAGFASNISMRLYELEINRPEIDLDALIRAKQMTMGTDGLIIISAVLAMGVVFTIESRQSKKVTQFVEHHTGPMPKMPYLPGDQYQDPRWQG